MRKMHFDPYIRVYNWKCIEKKAWRDIYINVNHDSLSHEDYGDIYFSLIFFEAF